MSRIQKLKAANLKGDTTIRLKFSDGRGVIHCHDNFEDEVVGDSSIVNYLSEMVTNPTLSNNNILAEMRESGLLEDYERGTFEFEDFIAEVISENWREYEWIDTTTEIHDYKRGHTEVSAVLETTAKNILEMSDFELEGWEIEVDHPLGVLEIE